MAESGRTTLSMRERNRAAGADETLPALRRDELRALLPGVEPERRLTDWGRSERIEGLMDRTLVEFFYRYWFRAEVEGMENVPATGGAMLVSNHSGALPPDAAMIAKAVREEHPVPRPVNITVEHFFKGYPGFSVLIPKIGCVAAHPANVHRLLFDEEQLVLVFPEGRKATEKLYKDRYRLRRFGRGGFVEAAMRAQAPIVPVCVVGAEESAPVFAQVGLMKRLTGLLYFPITPTFPHFGLLGMLGYLPAKFKIRFLEPIRFDEEGLHEDKGLVQSTAHEIRARIQESLWDMLRHRKSVWFG
jgi:1-acyl-sn-glycerol-3-phosphate acyltransferase